MQISSWTTCLRKVNQSPSLVMTYGRTNDVRIGGLANFDISPFQTVLVDELIPYTTATFARLRTSASRDGRSFDGCHGNPLITLKKFDTLPRGLQRWQHFHRGWRKAPGSRRKSGWSS